MSTRYPADDVGGTFKPVIESLSPGLSMIRLPRRPVRIGHATDVRDAAEPILTTGEVIEPGSAAAAFINAECADCDSQLVVLPNQEPGVNWLVIEHRPTCPAFRAMARRQP